jgi:hypothetical protein
VTIVPVYSSEWLDRSEIVSVLDPELSFFNSLLFLCQKENKNESYHSDLTMKNIVNHLWNEMLNIYKIVKTTFSSYKYCI